MAIADRFTKLLSQIEPTDPELEKLATHRSSVASSLGRSFKTNRVEPIGSHSRGTAVRAMSDLDLLVVLSVKERTWGDREKPSSTVMSRVRAELRNTFGSTDIGRDGQAVVVSFADGRRPVEVVPAFYVGPGHDNYPVFEIPDGMDGWMPTSPQAHNKYLRDADRKAGGKLRSVARLLKFWRTCWSPELTLTSFHVEMVLAASNVCVGAKSHATCLAEAFHLLAGRECRALRDPIGVSSPIPVASSDAKRSRTLGAVISSADRAVNAIEAEQRRDTPEAVRLWRLVFRDAFPERA